MDAATLERTISTWTHDPDLARSTPTVTASMEGDQALLRAGPFSWRTDLPVPLGGTNQAPSPTALLLGALAGCAVAFVRDTLAPQLGVRVSAVEATVSCAVDARGLLGMDGVSPELADLRLDVEVASPDGEAAVVAIAEVWRERCPIYLALLKPTDVVVGFRAR